MVAILVLSWEFGGHLGAIVSHVGPLLGLRCASFNRYDTDLDLGDFSWSFFWFLNNLWQFFANSFKINAKFMRFL